MLRKTSDYGLSLKGDVESIMATALALCYFIDFSKCINQMSMPHSLFDSWIHDVFFRSELVCGFNHSK